MRQRLDREGRITLSPEHLEALGVEPGQEVELQREGSRIVILRYQAKDPFADALKPQPKVSFDGLLKKEEDRRRAASREFEEKLKSPPKPSDYRPEDHPDFWR